MYQYQQLSVRNVVLSFLLTVGWIVPCHGGGVYLYEVNATEVGLAGAGWAARAEDATTVFTNPAGMMRIEGREFEAMLMPIYLQVDFEQNSNTTVSGGSKDASDWLPGGGLNYVRRIDDKSAWGISVGGAFGLGVDYGDEWAGRYYLTEVRLQAVGIQPSYARRVSDRVSIGAGLFLLNGVLEEKVAINNPEPGLGDGLLNIDDNDFSVQLNLGMLFEASDDLRIGVHYLSQADLEFETDREASNIGPVITAILDRVGLQSVKLNLDFTLPQSLIVSGYRRINERWEVLGNVGWQDWSEFGKVGVSFDSPGANEIIANRLYDDTWHAALGFRYRPGDAWRWNAGISYDSSMVDDVNRTLDLPVGESWRFGFGGSYARSDSVTLRFGYEIVWQGDLPVDVNRGPLSGRVSGEFVGTAIHALAFAYNKRF